MVAMKGVSKLRGQHGTLLYPQPEGQLGECMTKYGRELGDESYLGTIQVTKKLWQLCLLSAPELC